MLLPFRRQGHHLGQRPLPRRPRARRRLALAAAPELLNSTDLLETAWVCTPSWFIAESSLCYEQHRQELSG